MLTKDNYSKGLLIDEELIGGVSEHPEKSDHFIAYVMKIDTAEYLRYGEFQELEKALEALNSVERSWQFEKVGGCGGCKDGQGCGGGGCKKGACSTTGTCTV
jgi:hypothetical protein